MKSLVSLFLFLGSLSASATVDGHTRSYIVVQDVQSGDFFVERVPVIGCYGPGYGPNLIQFTAPYKASSNIGCGTKQYFDDINYLTCATVTDTKDDDTGSELQGLTLDISGCVDKNNPQLITMIRTAAKLNFPQSDKKKEVQLKIVKDTKSSK